jgi:hypothetical protein
MRIFKFLILFGFGVMIFGCGNSADKSSGVDGHVHGHGQSAVSGLVHDVDGWCVVHELPEDVCSLCNSKVAAEFKSSGDWCKEHNRAESQCFICDPNRKEKFAAQYEAQYGKKPPK